jgi:hypothetical protein
MPAVRNTFLKPVFLESPQLHGFFKLFTVCRRYPVARRCTRGGPMSYSLP